MSAILEKLPDLQKKLPVGETVLASFFVVCVFATGLLLDLVGSLALAWELSIFRKYLNRNKEWIGQLVAKYAEFLGEDFNLISTKPRFWDLRIRQQPLMLLAPFNRIESILISHLVLTGDPTRLESVMEQMRTYRIARRRLNGWSSNTSKRSLGKFNQLFESLGRDRFTHRNNASISDPRTRLPR